MDGRFSIAIIGAGCSGTLTALQSARLAPSARVLLLDDGRHGAGFGPGLAYCTRSGSHVLNVPAGRMSSWPDDPDHFIRWLRGRDPAARGTDFAPRSAYGSYLREQVEAESRLERIVASVEDLEPLGPAGGERIVLQPLGLAVDRVVLALGNPPPAGLAGVDATSTSYCSDPWAPSTREALRRDGPVLLIGTGLTMVDLALELEDLRHRGRRGSIHAISRHGLLPTAHRPPHGPPDPGQVLDVARWPRTAKGLLREVRRACAEAIDWREAINALRPVTQQLWRELPLAERERFLARLRLYWDIHRHRMAPAVAERIAAAVRDGRLSIARGRVAAMRPAEIGVEVDLRLAGEAAPRRQAFSLVVNCTGPAGDPLAAHPLLASAATRGLLRPDPLGLGLDATPEGVVLDAAGGGSRWLRTIGPLLKGTLWESTAVPEIRVHAEALARSLAAEAGFTASAGQAPPGTSRRSAG